jgi:hypothetical protein
MVFNYTGLGCGKDCTNYPLFNKLAYRFVRLASSITVNCILKKAFIPCHLLSEIQHLSEIADLKFPLSDCDSTIIITGETIFQGYKEQKNTWNQKRGKKS